MTKEERQALREKHRRDEDGLEPYCIKCEWPHSEVLLASLREGAQVKCGASEDGIHKYSEWFWHCTFCGDIAGDLVMFPCDVIKVLDATEELKPNDLKTKVECTHIIGLMTLPEGWDVIEHGQTDFAFTYCPKCGEKLLPSCDHNETKTIETSFYYLNLPPVVMDCLYCVKCKMKL